MVSLFWFMSVRDRASGFDTAHFRRVIQFGKIISVRTKLAKLSFRPLIAQKLRVKKKTLSEPC